VGENPFPPFPHIRRRPEKKSAEERLVKLEGFAADVREFTQVLTEMIRRHDERLREHAATFTEADRSIAALADAQIKTEDAVTRLTERLNALIERFDRNGQ
jgi:uncharacterized coiled-coil protein SlyX